MLPSSGNSPSSTSDIKPFHIAVVVGVLTTATLAVISGLFLSHVWTGGIAHAGSYCLGATILSATSSAIIAIYLDFLDARKKTSKADATEVRVKYPVVHSTGVVHAIDNGAANGGPPIPVSEGVVVPAVPNRPVLNKPVDNGPPGGAAIPMQAQGAAPPQRPEAQAAPAARPANTPPPPQKNGGPAIRGDMLNAFAKVEKNPLPSITGEALRALMLASEVKWAKKVLLKLLQKDVSGGIIDMGSLSATLGMFFALAYPLPQAEVEFLKCFLQLKNPISVKEFHELNGGRLKRLRNAGNANFVVRQANGYYVAEDADSPPGGALTVEDRRNLLVKHYQAKNYFKKTWNAACEAMDAFVAQETNGHIKKVLSNGAGQAPELFVFSVLYIKSLWLMAFDPTKTCEGMFRSSKGAEVPCLMMDASGKDTALQQMQYVEKSGQFQGVYIQYKSGHQTDLFAFALLPALGKTVQEVIAKLDIELLLQKRSDVQERLGHVMMPKLKFQTSIPSSVLRELVTNDMGLDLRDRTASFEQQIGYKQDEYGTEVAVVTAACRTRSRENRPPVTIKFDHPYVFGMVIQHAGQFPQLKFIGYENGTDAAHFDREASAPPLRTQRMGES